MNKKLLSYIILFLLWFNAGLAEEKNYDLTDSEIKEILEKIEESKKNEDFLQCVEIVRGSNLKRRFLRHQIKKIQCRLKYEELNANYSAVYRTEKSIIDSFKLNNFIVETNEWLHPDQSKFNKWKETRLKLISLRRY